MPGHFNGDRPAGRFVMVERHPLGPRLYLAGRRVHELAVGVALLAVAGFMAITGYAPPWHVGFASAFVGAWLVLKDWNDLFPSRRDTTRWTAWFHRPDFPLRTWRRAAWLPPVLGTLTFIVGLAVVASALLPGVAAQNGLLSTIGAPIVEASADVLKLPLGLTLMVMALPIARRRRRAWIIAVVALIGVSVLDLLRGPALEEALAAGTLAALTTAARGAFHVDPAPGTLRAAALRAPAIVLAAFAVSVGAVWAAAFQASDPVTWPQALEQAAAMLTLTTGPVTFTGAMRWLPIAVGAIGILGLLATVRVVSRPLRLASGEPDERALQRALAIVKAGGVDTLSFFKLRRDTHQLFSLDGQSMLAYRVEAGVLLVSGDPVGPAGSLPELIRDAAGLAERQGLKLAVVGSSERMVDIYRSAGLRRLYLGDEAIVQTGAFSLEGRRIRKLRQSVTRLERAGYQVEVRPLSDLTPGELAELEAISQRWRGQTQERGFSMALDTIGGAHQAATLVVVARDGCGSPRGFLHFVPCFGRRAMSLAAMRREPDTPNGLTEYMIVQAIAALRSQDVEEVSLNFVVFGRWMRSPVGRVERALGKLVSSRPAQSFQIASLHRFSAKFDPTWVRRDLWFEGALGLPRAGLAALWAEGQLPRLRRVGGQ